MSEEVYLLGKWRIKVDKETARKEKEEREQHRRRERAQRTLREHEAARRAAA